MPLQFDSETSKILYQGQEVGEHIYVDGKSTVRLSIEYSGENDWMVPLSWFAYGLSKLAENAPDRVLLVIEAAEDSIQKEFDVERLLIEKIVKRSGYVWKFHKTDADGWPSPLHAHDYEKGLKLDAITGNIYDVATRKRCKTLKNSILKDIQKQLKSSEDFAEKAKKLLK